MKGKESNWKLKPGDCCPIFYPTIEQFQDFDKYIRTVIEPMCYDVGLCKVVPPKGWFSRNYNNVEVSITSPIAQHVAGGKGVFTVDVVEKNVMTSVKFEEYAKDMEENSPKDLSDIDQIEKCFWRNLRSTMTPPLYGADLVGSLFQDKECCSWNLSNLQTVLRAIDLPGITRPMLYFGAWLSMFALHKEDMDLFSINYLHHGKPKFWYGIPPQYASQIDRMAASLFPDKYLQCQEFLRHKTSLISPSKFRDFNIPYVRTLQKAGEFVITFPKAYHSGFNTGYNIAEAVNFGSFKWIPVGLHAKICKCSSDSVRVDMEEFIRSLSLSKKRSNDDNFWIFYCDCGDYACSENPDTSVDGNSFECSICGVWMHIECIHKELEDKDISNYPDILLCSYCKYSMSVNETKDMEKTTDTKKDIVKTKRKRQKS